MGFSDIAVWILRGFGLLWVVGGVFALRQLWIGVRLEGMIDKIEQVTAAFAESEGAPKAPAAAPDKGRDAWLFAGAALLIAAGVAMALASRVAVPLLLALILQQMAYFIRQRRRELRAATPQEAAEARPTAQTVNGFWTSLVIAILAGWLFYLGKLA